MIEHSIWPLREPGVQVVHRHTCRPKLHTLKKKKKKPHLVATLKPSTQEIEVEESQVSRQSGLQSESLSQKTECWLTVLATLGEDPGLVPSITTIFSCIPGDPMSSPTVLQD